MRRFIAALLAFLERWDGAPARAEEVRGDEYWAEAIRQASARAYLTGHAAGELAGRQALAAELEKTFHVDGSREFTEADARSLSLRQVH